MNYAIVFLMAILVFSTVYYAIYGRKVYTGPIVEAKFEDDASNSVERSSGSDDNSMRKRQPGREKDPEIIA